jgi:ABC-2 type transport system permease protein
MNQQLAISAGPPTLLFHRLRWRQWRNSARLLVQQSGLRVLTIAGVSVLVCGFVFAISLQGFIFLHKLRWPGGSDLLGTVFDFLFLAMTLMLLFSTGLILYSSLFASGETAFLLHTPARADRVFAYKYQGAIAFSSWAFFLLGAPVLIAYGIVNDASWPFYVLLPAFFIGFVLLPGSLGALICLLVVNFIPRRRKQVVVAGIVVLAAAVGMWTYRLSGAAQQADAWDRDALHYLLGWFAFARAPVMPSHWMTKGLQTAARDRFGETAYYLALVWSNGLFLYLLSAWAARRLYRRGYNRVATGGSLRKRYGGGWLDRLLTRCTGFLDPQLRLLVVKDFRTFRRDPAQWAQVLIFTGLLTLYFTNIRRLFLDDIGAGYQNGISLLNLLATALLLCTYTSRFIYPMISLEGRRFWILGLLPLTRERLLWGKFVFAAVGGTLIAEFLVLLSDLMLWVPWVALVLHMLTAAVLAIGLSGLSVGLGAALPNFRETDPSKIAVGFGGTLNLVAGLLTLLLTVGMMAGPWHICVGLREGGELTVSDAPWWVFAGVLPGLAIGLTAVVFPLHIGARALRRMEF